MFCPHCGKALPDNAKFCSGCGKPADPGTEEAAPAEMPAGAAPTPAASAAVFVQPYPSAAESAPAPGGKKRGGKLLLLGGAIVVLVLVLAAVILAVTLLGGRGGAGYVYVTDDNELMFLKNLKENTKAVEFDDESNASSNVTFSKDGKYIYFVELKDTENIGTLYGMEVAKIGKQGEKPQKISSNVSCYGLTALDNGDLLYRKEISGKTQIWLCSKEETDKLADDVGYWGGIDESQTYGYYTETDPNDYTETLYRVELKRDGEKTVLIKNADVIYSDYDAEILLYGEEQESDTGVAYTLYSVRPGEEKNKLMKDVYSVMGIETQDGQLSFYYTTCQKEERTLYDFVSDSYKAGDEASALEEPVYPDWYDDYRPAYGIYTSDDGREYYESYSGIAYYLDPASYPDMDSVDIAYAMADDLYDEALAQYNVLYEEWYEVNLRNELREELRAESYTVTSYTLYHYADGTGTEVASRLASGFVDGLEGQDVCFYNKVPSVDGAIADVADLEYTYDVYDLIDSAYQVNDSVYYQNVAGVESEFELEGDKNYIGWIYTIGDKELVIEITQDGETSLCSYTVGKDALTYKDTLTDEDFYVVGFSDDALYYFADIDYEREEGDLYCYRGGESSRVAAEINSLMEVGSGGTRYVLTNCEYDSKAGTYVAELSLVTGDGKTSEISDEAWLMDIWFLNEKELMFIQDGDLYYWDGKQARRVASDVEYFWASEQEDYQTYRLYW